MEMIADGVSTPACAQEAKGSRQKGVNESIGQSRYLSKEAEVKWENRRLLYIGQQNEAQRFDKTI
jgi:hypothetical protein